MPSCLLYPCCSVWLASALEYSGIRALQRHPHVAGVRPRCVGTFCLAKNPAQLVQLAVHGLFAPALTSARRSQPAGSGWVQGMRHHKNDGNSTIAARFPSSLPTWAVLAVLGLEHCCSHIQPETLHPRACMAQRLAGSAYSTRARMSTPRCVVPKVIVPQPSRSIRQHRSTASPGAPAGRLRPRRLREGAGASTLTM